VLLRHSPIFSWTMSVPPPSKPDHTAYLQRELARLRKDFDQQSVVIADLLLRFPVTAAASGAPDTSLDARFMAMAVNIGTLARHLDASHCDDCGAYCFHDDELDNRTLCPSCDALQSPSSEELCDDDDGDDTDGCPDHGYYRCPECRWRAA